MDTIANLKEQAEILTPLLLFEATLSNGLVERWSTHQVTVGGFVYEARIVLHNFFEMQAAGDSGIDSIPRISIRVANSDSHVSQIESAVGFKGARLTVRFVIYDLEADAEATELGTVFQGVVNPPDEITETEARISAINRMSMQRVLLPPVRIQRRCPWSFPTSAAERVEAVDGGAQGRYSRFFRCGYSAGEVGGEGNLDGMGQPFTNCNFTRTDCVERGMFDADSGSTTTRRFGGIEFVPASILVRGHGEREQRTSALTVNEARYNDFVPLFYGTVWTDPPVVFARNDGNLTRMEVLLGLGKVHGVIAVLVNDVQIPEGVDGRDMTSSGWWNLFSDGGRNGGFNLNFTAPDGTPLGDPYGSVAALSIVVPNQINDGERLPRIRVLVQGVEVETFDSGSVSLGFSFSNNPSWVLLDVLRRVGWKQDEIDLGSFAQAAQFCDETIAAVDNQGNPVSLKRFQCNLALRSRRRAGDVVRGIRNSARLSLTYGMDGQLTVFTENSLLLQQPQLPSGSNATQTLNGGWPAYVYTDGTTPGMASAILRSRDGAPQLRLWSKPIVETPNRFSVEFADQHNDFQQDSIELLDVDDVARTGQELSGRLVVDGLPTFDQAARTLKFFLDKSVNGNRFIELSTSVKGFGQSIGDLIAVTYLKEGLVDQPFRILRIEPGENYRSVRITAQIHDDAWYNDTNGQITAGSAARPWPGSTPGTPHSLHPDTVVDGEPTFSIVEFESAQSDGSILVELEVGFTPATSGASPLAGVPILDLQPVVSPTGGALLGGQTLYYVVTAEDANGLEGPPSFVVRAPIPVGTSTNSVELGSLSFAPGAVSFSIYRGDLPSRTRLIATDQPIAVSFIDTGLAEQFNGAPDPQYDHANFYWRIEDTAEELADSWSADSVGSSALSLVVGALSGHSLRLIRGKGAGQERTVTNNSATSLTVAPDWEIEPDSSSVFVVSENTWHFGGRARTSPARFPIPNLLGKVVQVTGRAANAQNVESLEGLALVARHPIGGGVLGVVDRDVPPQPTFAVNAFGDGNVELGGIGFPALENTQTITSGLLTLHYRDELSGPSTLLVQTAVDGVSTSLTLSAGGTAQVGDRIQVENEVLLVDVDEGGGLYTVSRGQCGSLAVAHAASAAVYVLDQRVETVSFPRGLFGVPAAADWFHTLWLPDVRLACTELVLTNSFGDSPLAENNLSELQDGGLRTLRGGQFSLQIDGTLGIQSDASAQTTVQEPLSIRDVTARVKTTPVGSDLVVELRQDATLVTTLTILDGQIASAAVSGAELPVLQESSQISLDLTAVGSQFPGADMTVMIRL